VGFLGLKKAKWKDNDALVRLEGIAELTYDQQAIFAQLAQHDPDARVRAAATRRVNEQARLEPLLTSSDPEVVRLVRERLSSVAFQLINDRPLSACANIISGITNNKSLVELSLSAKDPAVRSAVFERLVQQKDVSDAMWSTIAIQDGSGQLAEKAIERIEKRSVLKDVARKAKAERIRAAAQARLAILEAEAAKPSAEQSRKARRQALEPLVNDATRWALSSEWDKAEHELNKIDSHVKEIIARFSEVTLDEEAQHLAERQQRSLRDFTQRRENFTTEQHQACAAHEALLSELSAIDGESFTHEQRAALITRWNNLPVVVGAQKAIFSSRFANELARLNPGKPVTDIVAAPGTETQSQSQSQPLVIAPAIATELEAIIAEAETLAATATDRLAARDRYRILHKRWNHLIADIPAHHPLRTRFLDAYAAFKAAGRAARETRDERNRERVVILEKLALQVEQFVAQPPAAEQLKQRFDALRQLQKEWKAVGPVRQDLIGAVRQRFYAACDKAFEPVKSFIEAEDWARFTHLGHAEKLISEVEQLAQVEDLAQVAAKIKDIQTRWRDIGALPGEKREATWQKYKAACDVIYERLKPHFAILDEQRQNNFAQKTVLVEEAEKLAQAESIGLEGSPADVAHKKAAVERMKAIQQEWKVIGPVPREQDRELWQRFRAASDKFFASHRADIDARQKEQAHNLNLKLALIVEAEDLATEAEKAAEKAAAEKAAENKEAASNNKSRAAAELMAAVKDIQARFKHVGHVPREQVETVWTRFRSACDRVYATLQDHLAALEKVRQENLAKKQALIQEAEAILQHENARWLKDEARALQKQWREIGHVPREQMDEVNSKFNEVCAKIFALE
jgi:Domain of Unknown Function (DUF349)